MKTFLFVFLSVLVFSPMVSFSQTEPDTCPPVFLNIRIENALNDIGPKPVIELNDTFDLCLYLFPLKKQNYNKISLHVNHFTDF